MGMHEKGPRKRGSTHPAHSEQDEQRSSARKGFPHKLSRQDKQHQKGGSGVYCRWTDRRRESERRGLWALCSESYGGRDRRWSARWWTLRASPPSPPFFRMTAPETLGYFNEDGILAQTGTGILGGARALEGLWYGLGSEWIVTLVLAPPPAPRGLGCLSGHLMARVAARVAVAATAAAARQLELGSRPAGGSQEAGNGGSGGRRGRRCARMGSTRRGRRARLQAGGDGGGPRGNPDETVVDGEQHRGQRDAEEVGADGSQAQPPAARAFAQPRATRALAAAAHTTRPPHLRSPLGPRSCQHRPRPSP